MMEARRSATSMRVSAEQQRSGELRQLVKGSPVCIYPITTYTHRLAALFLVICTSQSSSAGAGTAWSAHSACFGDLVALRSFCLEHDIPPFCSRTRLVQEHTMGFADVGKRLLRQLNSRYIYGRYVSAAHRRFLEWRDFTCFGGQDLSRECDRTNENSLFEHGHTRQSTD